MDKKIPSKFLGGAIVGLALGIAASVFFSSKTGKKLRKEAAGVTADFYRYLAPRLKKIKKLSREEYQELVKTSAEHYGKLKKLSEDKIREIIAEAQNAWKHFTEN